MLHDDEKSKATPCRIRGPARSAWRAHAGSWAGLFLLRSFSSLSILKHRFYKRAILKIWIPFPVLPSVAMCPVVLDVLSFQWELLDGLPRACPGYFTMSAFVWVHASLLACGPYSINKNNESSIDICLVSFSLDYVLHGPWASFHRLHKYGESKHSEPARGGSSALTQGPWLPLNGNACFWVKPLFTCALGKALLPPLIKML